MSSYPPTVGPCILVHLIYKVLAEISLTFGGSTQAFGGPLKTFGGFFTDLWWVNIGLLWAI